MHLRPFGDIFSLKSVSGVRSVPGLFKLSLLQLS